MGDAPAKLIAVLGGGIAGLSAAHRLTQMGRRVRLFEQGGRTGGVVATETTGGWLVESGPNSLQEETAEMAEALRELGLAGERVEAGPEAKNRYIVRAGRLVPVPLSPLAFLTTPLFSPGAKARVVAELFARPKKRAGDVAVADFFRDHFGSELVDAAVQPMISGTYAGDAARLSTREVFPQLWEIERARGSILRGLISGAKARRAGGGRIISFRIGLQALPDALAARLPPGTISLGSRVERLVPGKRWRICGSAQSGAFAEEFDAVVAALPAGALTRLAIGRNEERPLASLSGIAHPALSSLFLGYRRDQVAHPLDGFGVLVPAAEKRSMIGILFSSTLFPGRAPNGHVALTVMVGGMLQSVAAQRAPGDLLTAVRPDLRDLLGVTGDPVFVRHAFWPQAIPQYELGHGKHRLAIADCEEAHPGLFIGGQVCDGISVARVFSAGRALADRAIP